MEPSGAQKRGSSAGIFVKMSIFNLKRQLDEKMCELLLCVPGDFFGKRTCNENYAAAQKPFSKLEKER